MKRLPRARQSISNPVAPRVIVHSRSGVRLNAYVVGEIHTDRTFRIPNVLVGTAEVRLQRGWRDDAEVLAKKDVEIKRGQEIELDLP